MVYRWYTARMGLEGREVIVTSAPAGISSYTRAQSLASRKAVWVCWYRSMVMPNRVQWRVLTS